jgi:hypothetical protein
MLRCKVREKGSFLHHWVLTSPINYSQLRLVFEMGGFQSAKENCISIT